MRSNHRCYENSRSSSDSDYQEKLAVLVASGKAKEMMGVSLTQHQIKNLSEQDVEEYFKIYEALLYSKTCDVMADTFLEFSCKALAHFFPIDEWKPLKDLNDNLMVKRELGMIAGGLSLNY